jgi:hypothetical protein
MYKLRIIYHNSLYVSIENHSLWLTLRNNSLAGFEIISSHLGKLENLDLSYNIFNNNIFSHLRGLSSLKSLNLSGNMLLGSTTVNGKVVNISWHLLLFTFFRQFVVSIQKSSPYSISVLYHRFKNSIKITLNFTTYLIACSQFYTS